MKGQKSKNAGLAERVRALEKQIKDLNDMNDELVEVLSKQSKTIALLECQTKALSEKCGVSFVIEEEPKEEPMVFALAYNTMQIKRGDAVWIPHI